VTRLLGILAILTLRSCGHAAGDGIRVTYVCSELRIPVLYRADTAYVKLPDEELRLPIARSASGARYSDGEHTLWEHQGTARLELPGDTFTACVPTPPRGG
jgi:membrane-bound inhibitor of C-type lysozyme